MVGAIGAVLREEATKLMYSTELTLNVNSVEYGNLVASVLVV